MDRLSDQTPNRTMLELKLSARHLTDILSWKLPIAPCWNWNKWLVREQIKLVMAPNRTMLELKRGVYAYIVRYWVTPNRTMLELKHMLQRQGAYHLRTPNRTMLELKHRVLNGYVLTISLLPIAPCWNWNNALLSWTNSLLVTPNRTMLELKLGVAATVEKYRSCLPIAPCWNWNDYIRYGTMMQQTLPIAPCWNWNCKA